MTQRYAINLDIKSTVLDKVEKPKKASTYYGDNIFSTAVLRQCVNKETYEAFKCWINEGKTIETDEADEIARAMQSWAVNKGAVYYTHWFQPMTGLTAEKHDAFISSPISSGKIIEKFKGSNLILGEPDASSFPSGGMRTTFEARGYTAWDPSSPAFIMESKLGKTLCIPSIFISYHGEALDKKLPLLRSEEALCKSAKKLLKLFRKEDIKKVYSTCGPEQEYYLIDKNYYMMRHDLILTGRTLVGAPSPKDQQLEDQYFGSIKERVIDYMCEVTEEAYKLGIPIKTRHNEVAPHQYEFAPLFEESNIATDHNQLLMDLMKKVALRHNLVCLLHEKPFAGINGSGKHLNWSLSDSQGNNLLDPGKTPEANLQFLTILIAVIRAVYLHADLLRASIASAGNEHRLGANEAPPSIISVFLGGQLSAILDTIEKGERVEGSTENILDLGIGRLPKFNRDVTDRNRTSPFAFTGNKFEFRALGASQNISTPIMVLNTIIAESFDYMSDELGKATSQSTNFKAAVFQILSSIIKDTRPIRFEGDSYSKEWIKEAHERGLANEHSTPVALKALIKPENIQLFERYNILSTRELESRYNIWMELYIKTLTIEGNTLKELVDATIIPAAIEYQKILLENFTMISTCNYLPIEKEAIKDMQNHVSEVTNKIYYLRKNTAAMDQLLEKAQNMENEQKANFYFTELKPLMEHIRKHADELEKVVADKMWDLPKYREMLFIK
ncbi:MAG: glutamine synthetase III [bacterium]